MDNYKMLDTLNDAIYALEEAIVALNAIGVEHSNDTACCRDIIHDLRKEADELHAEIAKEEAAESAALVREYWRSVI